MRNSKWWLCFIPVSVLVIALALSVASHADIQQPAHFLGTFTVDDCGKASAQGFLISAGAPCGSGGGGGTTNQNIRQIGFHFDGQGAALSGTLVGCQLIPYAGTITGWSLDADVAGSATLGVRSVAFASYTGVAGYSGYTDVTGGGTAPTITTSTNATFSNLTSWVTTVTAGQEWCAQLSSPATATVVDLYLRVAAN